MLEETTRQRRVLQHVSRKSNPRGAHGKATEAPTDPLDAMLARLQLSGIRDRLDSLLGEAARANLMGKAPLEDYWPKIVRWMKAPEASPAIAPRKNRVDGP